MVTNSTLVRAERRAAVMEALAAILYGRLAEAEGLVTVGGDLLAFAADRVQADQFGLELVDNAGEYIIQNK